MGEVTAVDREEWKGRIFRACSSLERARNPDLYTDEEVTQKTEDFEDKMFGKFQTSRTAYLTRMAEMESNIIESLAEFRNQPPASAAQQAPVKPAGAAAGAGAGAAAAQQAPVNAPLSTDIQSLRDPLEKCRGILRVFNVFQHVKPVDELALWKVEFLNLFTRTTTLVAQYREDMITKEAREKEVEAIKDCLDKLCAKMDSNLKEIMVLCNVTTEAELIALDVETFTLLKQMVGAPSTARATHPSRHVSWMLGGSEVMARLRNMASSEPTA